MPTPEEFLSLLEERQLVPESTIELMRKKIQKHGERVSAKSLAKYLVDTEVLSEDQVEELLSDGTEPQELPAEPEVDPLSNLSALTEAVGDEEEDSDGDLENGSKKRRRSTRHKHLKKAKGNEFDSPLILLGFGGLAVLVVIGGILYYLLNSETGEEKLRNAQSAYEAGSYSQAIQDFSEFVEDFPSHAGISTARVQLVIAKLRQLVESRKYENGLAVAEELIPSIEDETDFNIAQGDLATLLPKIAEGLSLEAEKLSESGELDQTSGLVKKTTAALTLVGNNKYVPKSLRDDIQLAAIQETLARIERRRISLEALNASLGSMNKAITAGSPRDAYQVYTDLLARHPELVENEKLVSVLAQVAESEKESLSFTKETSSSVSEERPTGITASVAVGNQTKQGLANANGGTFVSVHGGVAYGVKADDGSLLWRRYVGVGTRRTDVIYLGNDILLIDNQFNDLLRLNATTGKLVWRTAIDANSTNPVVVKNRILFGSDSGRLQVFDLSTGERQGHVAMAQPLRAPVAFDEKRNTVYLAGEHSSLYSLDADSLACTSVFHLGHRSGGVLLAPVAISGKLAILENTGFETATLHLLEMGPEGEILGSLANERIEGTCDTPAITFGRRLIVASQLGEVRIFEISAEGSEREPIRELANRPAGRQKSGSRFLAATKQGIWVAGNRLTRSDVSLSDSRLIVEQLNETYERDQFVGPIQARGNVLLHSRMPYGTSYVALTATDLESGTTVWQTNVSLTPAAPVIVSSTLKGILLADEIGGLFLLDGAAIQAGSISKPIMQNRIDTPLNDSAILANGSVVATVSGSERCVPIDPQASRPLRAYKLDGKLACPPTAMGSGWLAPLSMGQILLLDLEGDTISTPFQASAVPNQRIGWLKPGVGELSGRQTAVVPESSGTIYCLQLTDDQRSLEEVAKVKEEGIKPNSGAAILKNRALFGVEDGKIGIVPLPNMDGIDTVSVGGNVAWGPFAINETIILATDTQKLVGINPVANRVSWSVPLENGLPIGNPLIEPSGVMLATQRGELLILNPDTGNFIKSVIVGQSLSSGPVPYGNRVLLTTEDAALLVVNHP